MIKRILICISLGLLIATIFTEVSYRILKRENRAPERIELVIPAGTAENIAKGQCRRPSRKI